MTSVAGDHASGWNVGRLQRNPSSVGDSRGHIRCVTVLVIMLLHCDRILSKAYVRLHPRSRANYHRPGSSESGTGACRRYRFLITGLGAELLHSLADRKSCLWTRLLLNPLQRLYEPSRFAKCGRLS